MSARSWAGQKLRHREDQGSRDRGHRAITPIQFGCFEFYRLAALHESASGPKRTSLFALHMSALGGKADMAVCEISLLRSLLGVKRT